MRSVFFRYRLGRGIRRCRRVRGVRGRTLSSTSSISSTSSTSSTSLYGLYRVLPAVTACIFSLLLPLPAMAQLPIVFCGGLAGCGLSPSNVLVNIIPRIGLVLIIIAAGLSVIMVVIGGFEMTTALGEEGTITKAKNRILYALAGLGLCLTAATIVAAVATQSPTGGGDILIGIMQTVIGIIITLFNVVFGCMVVYAGISMVLAGGDSGKFKTAGSTIRWAIVGAIVVNAARAIVQAFLNLNL